MNNRFSAVWQLIISVLITIFLIDLFSQGDFIVKLFLSLFIVCALITLIKSIFMLKESVKWLNYCNKAYIITVCIYVLCFVIAFCYIAIKNHLYMFLVVIFIALLVILFVIRNLFLKKNQSKQVLIEDKEKILKQLRFKMKLKDLAKPIVFSVILILGVVLLGIGIHDLLGVKNNTKNYKEVLGYFVDVDIYNQHRNKRTYNLTYYYIVDGVEYKVSTSLGFNMVPKRNSTRMIKYNPNNPEEAIIVGGESYILLLLIGGMFTVVSLVFFIEKFKKKDKLIKISRLNFLSFGIGLFLCILCFSFLYMMSGTFSLIEMFNMYGSGVLFLEIILGILIVVGFYLIGFSIYGAIIYKEDNKYS